MRDNNIKLIELMANNSIAAGETEYAETLIEVAVLQPNGNFSMQIEMDDASVGTATVHYECTNIDNTIGVKRGVPPADRFIKPANAAIFTEFAKNGGQGADGRNLADFNVETCYQVRIGVTAVGGDIKIKRLIAAVQ